jgi:integrase
MATNLYRRDGSPYWWARVQINGRDVRRSLRTTDRAVAKRRLKAILDDASRERAGEAPRSARPTWQDAVVRWHEMVASHLRPGTLLRYRSSLRMLDKAFAGRNVDELTSFDFHEFAAARQRAGTHPTTARQDLTVASLVMRVAKRAGWRSDNPVADELAEIPTLREPPKPIPLRLMARIIRNDHAAAGRALWRFLARTGCRLEEAGSLEWWQLDLDQRTCVFADTKTRSPRTIDLTGPTVRDLRRLRRSATSPFVFRASPTARFKFLSSRWRDLVNRTLGIQHAPRRRKVTGRGQVGVLSAPPRCHDLRHTFAIRWVQRGGNIYDLSKHLGHSSVVTTEIYLGWQRRPRYTGANAGTAATAATKRAAGNSR